MTILDLDGMSIKHIVYGIRLWNYEFALLGFPRAKQTELALLSLVPNLACLLNVNTKKTYHFTIIIEKIVAAFNLYLILSTYSWDKHLLKGAQILTLSHAIFGYPFKKSS